LLDDRDELMFASLIDPSVIKKSEIMYLDVDIDHGSKYGHRVVWKKPDDVPRFFLPYSGSQAPDREKWLAHLTSPAHLHPASVPSGGGCEAVRGHLRCPDESIAEGQGARGEKLRIFAVEPAKGLTGADLAAREGHGLKGSFIAKFWLAVWLLRGAGTIACKFLFASILLGHKPSSSARGPSRSSQRCGRQTFCSVPPT
jgi:hypothetical protein